MNLNRIEIIGYVTAEPVAKQLKSGKKVVNFTIATNHLFYDSSTKEKKESVQFHRVSAWGKLADIAENYLHKGKQVYAEGRLMTKNWSDKDNNKHYTAEIHLENLILLGKPEKDAVSIEPIAQNA